LNELKKDMEGGKMEWGMAEKCRWWCRKWCRWWCGRWYRSEKTGISGCCSDRCRCRCYYSIWYW